MESNSIPFTLRTLTRSIVFRFTFCYLVLFIWPFPLYFIPYSNYLFEPLAKPLHSLIEMAGPILLGETYLPYSSVTGSGDTSFMYARCFVFLILAAIATVIWSAINRKHQVSPRLFYFISTLTRYFLAAVLFSYGFQKVIPLQFTYPTVSRLSRTYRESSPMGLLWTFMGSSELYTIFTGVGEVVAGALLLFRRTNLLGSFVAAFVLLHVFVLNIAYDVPVKLNSFHYLCMSLFLMSPHVGRLINLFILNKTASPDLQIEVTGSRRQRWLSGGVKIVLILFICVQPLVGAIQQKRELVDHSAARVRANTTTGKYKILEFKKKVGGVWELNADKAQWAEIGLVGNIMQTTFLDGFTIAWHCSIAENSHRIKVVSKDIATFGEFTFEKDGDTLSMKGSLNEDSISVVSRRVSDDAFLLSNRKFRWIQEEPFNR